MKELMTWILSNWKMYWEGGYYQYLLLAAVIYLLVQKRKEKNTRFVLLYSSLLLFIFLCPLTAAIIHACLGDEVYWRVLWLLPTVFLIALAAADFLKKRKTKIQKLILMLLFSAIIAVSGKGMFAANNFFLADNPQKVPSEVVYLCNLINNKAAADGLELVRLATDEHIGAYARVYDPSILMPYGRRGKGSLGKYSHTLYKQVNSTEPNFKQIAKCAKKLKCNFIIMDLRGQSPMDTFSAYGYAKIGELNKYTIFQFIEQGDA